MLAWNVRMCTTVFIFRICGNSDRVFQIYSKQTSSIYPAFLILKIIQIIIALVLWSEFLATQRRCIVFPARYELNLYMLCRRK
jgi:hypothetical protein